MMPCACWPLLALAAGLFAGCAQPGPAPLHAWGDLAERAAFPESAPFIDPLIQRIETQRLKEHRP